MRKNILIITDLEGISGVSSIEEVQPEYENYQRTLEYLMDDTNAAINGAFLGGATDVYVVDGHCTGINFLKGALDKRAIQIPASEFSTNPPDKYDALITIGCHPMAGTTNGFLDHTQSASQWFEYKVGGKAYGEIGQQAITLGAYDIPLVMVSGDLLACKEARELVPTVATATVKTGTCRNRAECIPHIEAMKLIENAACDGVQRMDEIKPYKIQLPTEIELTLYRSDYCDEICRYSDNIIRNGRTVIKTVTKIEKYRDILF